MFVPSWKQNEYQKIMKDAVKLKTEIINCENSSNDNKFRDKISKELLSKFQSSNKKLSGFKTSPLSSPLVLFVIQG